MILKRNCNNCKHLEWIAEDSTLGDCEPLPCCNKREYRSETDEIRHLDLLDKSEYRERQKMCCELKQVRP